MAIIEFAAPSRATKAHIVSVCGVDIFFSYSTPVGCSPPDAPSFQRENVWGPTTGRHLNEWGFNRPGIEKLGQEEFERRMNLAIFRSMAKHIADKVEA